MGRSCESARNSVEGDDNIRRRFGFVKGNLTSFEDEWLQAGEDLGTSQILLDEIERPRVGPMRDIVATI